VIILIIGFEPFGMDNINASEVIVGALPGRLGKNRIEKCILPVVYEKALTVLYKSIADNVRVWFYALDKGLAERTWVWKELRSISIIRTSQTTKGTGLLMKGSGKRVLQPISQTILFRHCCPA